MFERESTYFQEFLDSTKKETHNLHKPHTIPSPTVLLETHCILHTLGCEINALVTTKTLKTLGYNALQQANDCPFSIICAGEINGGQLSLLESFLPRAERREILNAFLESILLL